MKRDGRWWTPVAMAALTLLGTAVPGYHPNSEDGGIYLAEIKRALDPSLYPHGTEFVSGHLGPPVFTAGAAWLVHGTGLRLDIAMAVLHVSCVVGTLLGVRQLAGQCFSSEPARWGAVGLVAMCLGMPVAGTSLLLMDPYVTARSVATAMTLLGLAGLADFLAEGGWRRLVWGVAALGVAGTVHPLMGGYGIVEAVALVCVVNRRGWVRIGGIAGLAAGGAAAAGLAQALAAPETAEYAQVASTRYYWFLGQWQWFELIGLAAPMAILAWVGWRGASDSMKAGLARMAVCVGGLAAGIAVVFAREAGRVHAVARMQPLRCFQIVYVLMVMAIGGWLGERVLGRSVWRWGVATALAGGLMAFVQNQTYPASDMFELPGVPLSNRWEQAFVWVKENTPRDALFALDEDYVHRPGEDAQVFRAVAERSALPDYSKDGGQAAIRPELTSAWVAGQRAQAGLTKETDAERLRALKPFGVTWMVIEREGVTGFPCPYTNEQVKVCRMD